MRRSILAPVPASGYVLHYSPAIADCAWAEHFDTKDEARTALAEWMEREPHGRLLSPDDADNTPPGCCESLAKILPTHRWASRYNITAAS